MCTMCYHYYYYREIYLAQPYKGRGTHVSLPPWAHNRLACYADPIQYRQIWILNIVYEWMWCTGKYMRSSQKKRQQQFESYNHAFSLKTSFLCVDSQPPVKWWSPMITTFTYKTPTSSEFFSFQIIYICIYTQPVESWSDGDAHGTWVVRSFVHILLSSDLKLFPLWPLASTAFSATRLLPSRK